MDLDTNSVGKNKITCENCLLWMCYPCHQIGMIIDIDGQSLTVTSAQLQLGYLHVNKVKLFSSKQIHQPVQCRGGRAEPIKAEFIPVHKSIFTCPFSPSLQEYLHKTQIDLVEQKRYLQSGMFLLLPSSGLRFRSL